MGEKLAVVIHCFWHFFIKCCFRHSFVTVIHLYAQILPYLVVHLFIPHFCLISLSYSAKMSYTLQNKIFSCRQFRSLRIMGLLLASQVMTCLLSNKLDMMTIFEDVISKHNYNYNYKACRYTQSKQFSNISWICVVRSFDFRFQL